MINPSSSRSFLNFLWNDNELCDMPQIAFHVTTHGTSSSFSIVTIPLHCIGSISSDILISCPCVFNAILLSLSASTGICMNAFGVSIMATSWSSLASIAAVINIASTDAVSTQMDLLGPWILSHGVALFPLWLTLHLVLQTWSCHSSSQRIQESMTPQWLCCAFLSVPRTSYNNPWPILLGCPCTA